METPKPSTVRQLIFPAIAAAGLVFGVSLTVMGTYRGEWFEREAKVRAADSQRDYALTNRGRDTAIRVVGVAIVFSVATGLATVELLRKWYGFRDRADAKAETLGLMPLLDMTEEEGASMLNSSFEPQSDLRDDRSAAVPLELPLEEPMDDALIWGDPVPISIPVTVELLPGTYSLDRQVLPGTLHSQLVLHYEGRTYRFVRTAETTDVLLRYCDVLDRSLRSIVVTPLSDNSSDNSSDDSSDDSKSGYGLWEQVG
jgi:hypothetical protein